MLVQFANTWLTNDGSGAVLERAWTSTQDLALNGKEILQEVDVVESATQALFDRGNMIHSLTFSVTRNFSALLDVLHNPDGTDMFNPDGTPMYQLTAPNPVARASAFALTHFALLPKCGLLTLTCGGWGEQVLLVQAATAFLESAKSSPRGVQVTTAYAFKFATLAAIASPGNILNKDGVSALKNKNNAPISNK